MQGSHGLRGRLVWWLYAGFVLTGIGTTLLGCTLPSLTAGWHLNDNRAGILFAAQFSGSALGALLLGSNFLASLIRGYCLLVVSAISIVLIPDAMRVLCFFFLGLALGLSMTATSMLIGSAYSDRRGRALSWLNGFWTIGAALSPQIAFAWTLRWAPPYVFAALGIAVGIVCAAVLTVADSASQARPREESNPTLHHVLPIILMFSALGCLYVGVEASIGGWLMSYVHRLPAAGQGWSPVATSAFWVALLCGRMLAPAVLLRTSEVRLLSATTALAFVSSVLMLISRGPLAITIAAAGAGLMLGPIYPLCLAKTMESLRDSPQSKWVFALSGLGGAVFPWITGAVSAHTASLRQGLLVPTFALTGMILLIWYANSAMSALKANSAR